MENIDSLVSWAKAHGAQISEDVQFRPIAAHNIGAVSASQTSQINVPVSIIVKLSDAHAKLGFDIAEILKSSRNVNGPLKLFLARERAVPDSFYGPYVKSLPTSQQINSPYVWLARDKQGLSGTNLGSSLRDNLNLLVEEWWLVIAAIPEDVEKPQEHYLNMKFYYEHKFYEDQQLHEYICADSEQNWTSFPAYLWASMILKSRSFPSGLLKGLPDAQADSVDFSQDDVAMLVPVIDLLNHNPRAVVTWAAENGGFQFSSQRDAQVSSPVELFNNYGRKGNEELLLAYGFCLEDNSADTVALKIKIPLQLLPEIEAKGVKLPKLSDYTTSVVKSLDTEDSAYEQYKDGVLFFISALQVPSDLVQVFQWLVKSPWEGERLTLRMQLSGLNHLRQAVESKAALLDANQVPAGENEHFTNIYLDSQRRILKSAVSHVKHAENELLTTHKLQILTLKAVFKKDVKFQQALLVTMGVTSYSDILDRELMDQVWLLYLIRCYNKSHYDLELFLPQWIHDCFVRMDAETEISAGEVVQFQGLYENVILPMNKAVPEIFNVGKWTVRELIVSTKLLDTIGFVRGKKQECLLVNDFEG